MSHFEKNNDILSISISPSEEDIQLLTELISKKYSFSKAYGIDNLGIMVANQLNEKYSNDIIKLSLFIKTSIGTNDWMEFYDAVRDQGLAPTQSLGIPIYSFSEKPLPVWIHPIFKMWG